MIYNMYMYDVVLLPTSWCWRAGGGTRGTAVLMMTGLLVQAHQVCVLATQLKLLYLPHILTRCGSTKHLHYLWPCTYVCMYFL